MNPSLRAHLVKLGFGLFMGFALARIGFADYGELHAMFTFHDLRLFLTFMGAVAVTAAWRFALRMPRAMPNAMNRGVLPGAAIFGIGWVLCGACPGIAFAEIGTLDVSAVFTLGGILAGTWVYPHVHARWFRWDPGMCET